MRPSSAKNRTEKSHGEQESAPESVTSKSVEFQLYVTLIIHPRVADYTVKGGTLDTTCTVVLVNRRLLGERQPPLRPR